MWPNPLGTTDLITFTEGILNGKLHFLSSGANIQTGTSYLDLELIFTHWPKKGH